MVNNIFNFFKKMFKKDNKKENKEIAILNSNLTAEDCMVPRSELDFIDADDPHEQIINSIYQNKQDFIVVCEDNLDNIIGVINIFEYIKDEKKHIIKPKFITLNEELISFYNEVIENKTLQIVVNEFGDIKGVITPESIIKNIFEVSNQIKLINNDNIIVEGKITLKHFQKIIPVDIELEDYQSKTLSGFILEFIGYLPKKFENIKIKNLNFEVLEIKDRYIKKLKVSILNK